jgi:hypothetical protein
MKEIATLFAQRQIQPTRHEFEFQEVCSELEPTFGKAVWSLPHRAGVTEWKLREAGRIAKMRGKPTLAYLIGVLKRL